MEVNRKEIDAICLCSICDHVIENCTTISCFHSFCSICIRKVVASQLQPHCPTCGIDLGPIPATNLHADPRLQAIIKVLQTPPEDLPPLPPKEECGTISFTTSIDPAYSKSKKQRLINLDGIGLGNVMKVSCNTKVSQLKRFLLRQHQRSSEIRIHLLAGNIPLRDEYTMEEIIAQIRREETALSKDVPLNIVIRPY